MAIYSFYKGKILEDGQLKIAVHNRAFNYGDGFFETILLNNSELPLWKEHSKRIFNSLDCLQLEKSFIDQMTEELFIFLKKSEVKDGVLKILFFRDAEGKYRPENNKVNYLFHLNSQIPISNNWKMGVYQENFKSKSKLSNIKSNNALIYVLASKYAADNSFDDCFVLNNDKEIADTTLFNVFWKNENVLYTTPLNSACVDGVMRRFCIDVFRNEGIELIERAVTVSELKNANAIYLTNAIRKLVFLNTFENRDYLEDEINSSSEINFERLTELIEKAIDKRLEEL